MELEIKEAVAAKLNELFTTTVYDEYIPQGFDDGSFFIDVISHEYSKEIANRRKSLISFDLSYFPVDKNNFRNECASVKETIFRAFDILDGFRIEDKKAQIVDAVLHIQFMVQYRELKDETETKMAQLKYE